MERVTFTTKSFIIALALVHGRINAEQAALASQVEVASQIERWGEVEDCTYAHRSVHPTRLNSDTQPTMWTTMTCDDTLGAQLVLWLRHDVDPKTILGYFTSQNALWYLDCSNKPFITRNIATIGYTRNLRKMT